MKGKLAIKTYLREVEGLGEFKFIFTVNTKHPKDGTYFVESFWNPSGYGRVDFIVGYFVNNIDEEIKRYEDEEGFQYFIDGARISCECAVKYSEDNDGTYEGILIDYFGYEVEQMEEVLNEDN